jgi:hypothetical protein
VSDESHVAPSAMSPPPPRPRGVCALVSHTLPTYAHTAPPPRLALHGAERCDAYGQQCLALTAVVEGAVAARTRLAACS